MATPPWLTDTDYPAPCYCGRPHIQGEPTAIVTNAQGLKRMMHMDCLHESGLLDDD